MDGCDVRLECLKLAREVAPGREIERAREFADFVLGRNDAEIIRAAHDLAARVKP